MKEIEREPVHQQLLELSKVQGKLKALDYFNENDLLEKEQSKRLLLESLDKLEKVSQYILTNYQKLRTY
tara:strand:- start:1072 stop:1278 length:207 start_codon:yes stop_codon:yes gene_type:complete